MHRWNPIDLCFDPTQPPMNDWQKRNAPHIFNPYQVKLMNKHFFYTFNNIHTSYQISINSGYSKRLDTNQQDKKHKIHLVD